MRKWPNAGYRAADDHLGLRQGGDGLYSLSPDFFGLVGGREEGALFRCRSHRKPLQPRRGFLSSGA